MKETLPFKKGDKVTISKKPDTWSAITNGKCGLDKVKYPYTFTVENIVEDFDYISIFDGVYGWTYYPELFSLVKEREEFVLPEFCCTKITKENAIILGEFYGKHCYDGYRRNIPNSYIGGYITSHNIASKNSVFSKNPGSNYILNDPTSEFPEITFEQFKQYVLKEPLVKESKCEFKKGDYIVTLSVTPGFRTDCAKDNYCFKVQETDCILRSEVDLRGNTRNVNNSITADKSSNLKDWRYATPTEIAEYEFRGKPYDVTTLIKTKCEFEVGDILYFLNNKGHFTAPTGSIAKCIAPFNGKYINIDWIDDKGVGQNNGEYCPENFRKATPEEIAKVFKVGDWVKYVNGNEVYKIISFDKDGWACGNISGGGWHPKVLKKATQEEINSVISPKEKNRIVNGVEMIKGEYYYCESNHNPSSYFVFIYDRHGTGEVKDFSISYIYTSQQVSTLYGKFGLEGINDAHHANMRLATIMEREWLDACIKAGKYLEPNDFKIELDASFSSNFEKLGILFNDSSKYILGIDPISTPKDCVKNPLDDTPLEVEIIHSKIKQITF